MHSQHSTEEYMLLSKQNIELQKIIDSQAQQLLILQKQLESTQSQVTLLTNQNAELKLKCSEYKANQDRVHILKQSLCRDFGKLKMKVQVQEEVNRKLQAKFEVVKEQLKQRQVSMLDFIQEKQATQRQLRRVQQYLLLYRRQNEDLRDEIRQAKLSSIDQKLNSIIEFKQNISLVPKNANNKTAKKKTRKCFNLSTSFTKCTQNISCL